MKSGQTDWIPSLLHLPLHSTMATSQWNSWTESVQRLSKRRSLELKVSKCNMLGHPCKLNPTNLLRESSSDGRHNFNGWSLRPYWRLSGYGIFWRKLEGCENLRKENQGYWRKKAEVFRPISKRKWKAWGSFILIELHFKKLNDFLA